VGKFSELAKKGVGRKKRWGEGTGEKKYTRVGFFLVGV